MVESSKHAEAIEQLIAFQNHLAETTDEILDVLEVSDELDVKYNVVITINGKSIEFDSNADTYSGIDLLLNEELKYHVLAKMKEDGTTIEEV